MAIIEEDKRLKRELKIAQEEREILKKATAYFAKHGQQGTPSLTITRLNLVSQPCAESLILNHQATMTGQSVTSALSKYIEIDVSCL